MSSDGSIFRTELFVRDFAWMGAIGEIIREKCKQLEQKHPPVGIQAFFRVMWSLVALKRIRDISDERTGGIPLYPALRYLVTLQSGEARTSALVDVQIHRGDKPQDTMVTRFLEYRLSDDADAWNPQTEPLLMVGVDALKYYAAKLEPERDNAKKPESGR
jgi:hypothetical protein